jgi:hypothetical protein
MTQIVSMLSQNFVLLVEDRLVTDPIGREIDALANKNIIYQARDAIVCMGYTGPAFIGRLPTDSWIAWKLCEQDPPSEFLKRAIEEERGGIIIGKPPSRGIGQAVTLLENELKTSEVASLNYNFELLIVGWKWKRKRGTRVSEGKKHPIPIAWSVFRSAGGSFAVKRYERMPPPPLLTKNARYIALPDGNMSKVELQELTDKIKSLPIDRKAPSAEGLRPYEHAIVDAIRAVAARNPRVGSNCMSILLAPPHRQAFVRATFFPQELYSAKQLGVTSAPPEYSAGLSPWIIGPTSVTAPQVVVGGTCRFISGGFEIFLEGPDKRSADFSKPGMAGLFGQIRPPRPK